MKIFLTGATGFIGGHLARGLGDEHELIPSSGDLRQPLAALPERADVVIHAAALVAGANQPADVYRETNVNGTLHAARAARTMQAARFIYLSTGGVYRASAEALTEDSEIAPQGDYAVTKWEGEQAALGFRPEMRVQILRLFFPYGPGQRKERLMPRLIERVSRGEAVTAAGGEGPWMNPIYIDDLVEAMRRILAIDDDLVLNLAGPERVSIRGIVERIGRLVGVEPKIEAGAPQESWVADSSKAARLTGYVPKYGVEEGLRRMLPVS